MNSPVFILLSAMRHHGETLAALVDAATGGMSQLAVLGGILIGLKLLLQKPRRSSRASSWTPRLLNGSAKIEAPALAASVSKSARATPAAQRTLEDLSWQQFELLVGEIYRRKGCAVELSLGLGADGGIDLKIRRGDETAIVQCKHWKTYKVGVKDVRELLGVMAAETIPTGIFITTSTFTAEARRFAVGKRIKLLERSDLTRLVSEAQRIGEDLLNIQTWTPEFAVSAKVTLPICPSCAGRMLLREGRSGPKFWGCAQFPRCRGKREARHDLLPYGYSA